MKAWSVNDSGEDSVGGEPRALMTLRVSRDSGRTWSPATVVREGDPVVILENPVRYPDCLCARCLAERTCPARAMRPAV